MLSDTCCIFLNLVFHRCIHPSSWGLTQFRTDVPNRSLYMLSSENFEPIILSFTLLTCVAVQSQLFAFNSLGGVWITDFTGPLKIFDLESSMHISIAGFKYSLGRSLYRVLKETPPLNTPLEVLPSERISKSLSWIARAKQKKIRAGPPGGVSDSPIQILYINTASFQFLRLALSHIFTGVSCHCFRCRHSEEGLLIGSAPVCRSCNLDWENSFSFSIAWWTGDNSIQVSLWLIATFSYSFLNGHYTLKLWISLKLT